MRFSKFAYIDLLEDMLYFIKYRIFFNNLRVFVRVFLRVHSSNFQQIYVKTF